jgi:hypothetical protein
VSKAVTGGQLNYVSASAIQLFVSCPRKWAAEYVFGIKGPAFPEQDAGTRIHDQMEQYVLDGTLPTHESALAAISHIQTQKENPYVTPEQAILEDGVRTLSLAGIPVKGFIDYYNIADPSRPHILDYKSTKNFRYSKTEEQLERNIQAIIYMGWAILNNPEAEAVQFDHLNLRTWKDTDPPTPGVKLVSISLTREEIETRLQGLESVVEEMKAYASVGSWEHVEPNQNHCNEFRGRPCHMLERCTSTFTKNQAFASMFSKDAKTERQEQSVSIKEKFAKQRQAQGAVVEAAPQKINPPDAAKPLPVAPYVPPTAPADVFMEQVARDVAAVEEMNRLVNPRDWNTLTLFIDAHPVKGSFSTVQLLEDEIARRAAPIAERRNVLDIREAKYAEGVNELLATFKAAPLKGVWSARSGGLSTSVIEVLIPTADVVIKGSW